MDLEILQKVFESEVATATQSFYVWKAINNQAVADESIYRGINAQALIWNITLHSLQTTYFITLGRIFDEDPQALSANSYLSKCLAHLDQFNSEHLKRRKLATSNLKDPEWLPDYLNNMQVPTKQELRALKKTISRHQSRYVLVCKPIRNKIMAHRELSTIDNVSTLFAGTLLSDLEDIIVSLNQIHRVIWEFLYNGRKTELSDHTIKEESYVSDFVEKLLSRLKA